MTAGPGDRGPEQPAQRPEEAGQPAPGEPPHGEDAVAAAATAATRRSGMNQILGENFSIADAVGGVRGLVEAVAPGLVFVVVFIATGALVPPLVASLAVAVLAMIVRLAQRTPVTQAAGGLVGVLIGVVWAWRSGEAENYFAMGLWTNAAYAVALLVALVAGWPAVGVVVSLLKGEGFAWRKDPALLARRRRFVIATWLWIGMFALRLAVQVPLYLDAAVAWLGTARIVMGVPLWALTLWATWVLVREPRAPAAH